MKMFGVLDLETQMEGCRLNADSLIMPTPGERHPQIPAFSANSPR
jgi:hypothetical protein